MKTTVVRKLKRRTTINEALLNDFNNQQDSEDEVLDALQ